LVLITADFEIWTDF